MTKLNRGHDVHPGAVWIWREATDRWPQETCSFCGSVNPLKAAAWLNNGNDASGSTWKLGWPHKFYVSDDEGLEWKFYSEHLTELSSEDFATVTEAIARVLNIRFEYDTTDRMLVRAPSYGYQAWVIDGVNRGSSLPGGNELKAWETELNTEMLGD